MLIFTWLPAERFSITENAGEPILEGKNVGTPIWSILPMRTEMGRRSARGTSHRGSWRYWHASRTAAPGTGTCSSANRSLPDARVWRNSCLSGNPGAECLCTTSVHLDRVHAPVNLAVVPQSGDAFLTLCFVNGVRWPRKGYGDVAHKEAHLHACRLLRQFYTNRPIY